MVFIPLLFIITYSIIIALIFNASFCKALPTSIYTIIAIVYIFGFFDSLMIGLYVIVFIFILFAGFVVVNYSNYKERLKCILLDRNLFLFLVLYLFVIWYTSESYLTHWDDFSHWAPFAKDMFLRNKFYFTEGHIATTHLSYPPFQAIFQYIFARLSNNFSDQNLFRAQIVIVISIVFPIFEYLKNKSLNKYILTILLVLVYYISMFRIHSDNPLYCILPDCTMGIIFGSLMIKSFEFNINSKFSIYDYIVSGIALVLIKQMGIALFLGAYFTLIIMQYMTKAIKLEFILKYILLFLIPIVFISCWYIYVRKCQIVDQFDIDKKISLRLLFNILFNRGGLEYQKTTLNNFIKYLYTFRTIYLKYYQWVLLSIISYLILCLNFIKKYGKKLILFLTINILGYLIYTFAILCLYLFCFPEHEAIGLACIWRYLSSYIISVPLICGYFLAKESMTNHKLINIYTIVLFFISLILVISIFISKQKKYYCKKSISNSIETKLKNDWEIVDKSLKNSRILILQENGTPLMGAIFQYHYLDNRIFRTLNVNVNSETFWDSKYNENELVDLLKGFDYIYPYSVGNSFNERYGHVFGTNLKNRTHLYKAEKNGNSLIFNILE